MEKDVASPVEKAMVGPHALEGRGMREAWWRGRKMGYCTLAQWRCWLVERRGGGEGDTMETMVIEAAWAHGGACTGAS
jgi:hypothetical protein